MILEICSNTIESAVNAEKAGASRVELGVATRLGGVTPSYGMIKETLKSVNIPVYVLIRPREGDFEYTEEEYQSILHDIAMCKDLGCHGVVTGFLTAEGKIDKVRTQKALEVAGDMDFTFHRAFDQLDDLAEGLQDLISLGVPRVLSSGGKETAVEAYDRLQVLQKMAEDKIVIMPGSGINQSNVHFFTKAGFTEVHSSASELVFKVNKQQPIPNDYAESNPQNIQAILAAMDRD
jgi:copper homeostasis protein